MSDDDALNDAYLHGVDVGIDLYIDRAHKAEALAADRLRLLRRAQPRRPSRRQPRPGRASETGPCGGSSRPPRSRNGRRRRP